MFTPVKEVLTPHLNTSQDKKPVNNIRNLDNEEQGVKVLTPFEEGDKNISKESQDRESGDNHGNGQEMKDLDKQKKALPDEFSDLMNSKATLTPHLCRKGCKHYDPVGDPKAADFNEYCWKSKGSLIECGCVCKNFEDKNPGLPQGVLVF